MRKLLAGCFVFIPFVAGCLAFGSESMSPRGAVDLSLDSLLIVYGPMAGMLIWFMYREKVREDRAEKRDAELRDVIAQNTKAMTINAAATTELRSEVRAELQKNRTAIYQIRDEKRGNTRIMRRNEEE